MPRFWALCVSVTLLYAGVVHAARKKPVEAMLKRAESLVARGDPSRAIAVLRRAMQHAPENPTPVARFAALVLPDVEDTRAWTPDAALIANATTVLTAIDEVAARDDSGVGARADSLYTERIWALALAQSHTAAIDVWTARDVRFSREHAQVGRQLAALAIRRDDLSAARRVLEACIRFNAEDDSLRSDLGAVELAAGNVSAAVSLFREVALAHPNDLDAQRDLAGATLADGDALSATGLLQATDGCLQLCDCALELTRAAITARQSEVAVGAAGDALRVCIASDPEPALWLATAEQLAGHIPQAHTAYRLALQRDPQSPRAHEGLRALGSN